MKKLFSITLGLVLLTLVFTSCSLVNGALGNNEALYKAVIERYCNSVIQANMDNYLDSLDPSSPLYPSAADIEKLRAAASEIALQGGVLVRDLTVLEESTDRAQVEAALMIRIDLYETGEFQTQTANLTFELSFKDGAWRIFDQTIE